MRRLSLLLMCLTGGFSSIATASWFATQFAADAVQTYPQRPPMSGRMYVGKDRVRTEFHQNNQTMVEIIDPKAGVAYLELPAKKSYFEHRINVGTALRAAHGDNPCEGMQGAKCTALGTEQLNGRAAKKWDVEVDIGGRQVHSTQWTDVEHKFPVRQEYAGKVPFELHFLGEEKINGRVAEKWESTMTSPDGKTMRALQWYDPRLNTAIRQQMPNGFVRELRNIQEGPQPVSLFEIPTDYRKIDAPTGPVPQGVPGR